VLSQLSKTPSVDLSSEDRSRTNSPESLAGNQEPRRSGYIKQLTCNTVLQVSQDRAAAASAAVLAAGKIPKGKKVRKAKLMNTSQLLDKFT
jgi:hypothetical protein